LFFIEEINFSLNIRCKAEAFNLCVIYHFVKAIKDNVFTLPFLEDAFDELEALDEIVEDYLDFIHLFAVIDLACENWIHELTHLLSHLGFKSEIVHVWSRDFLNVFILISF